MDLRLGTPVLWGVFRYCYFTSVIVEEVNLLVVFKYGFRAMKAVKRAVLLVFILQTSLFEQRRASERIFWRDQSHGFFEKSVHLHGVRAYREDLPVVVHHPEQWAFDGINVLRPCEWIEAIVTVQIPIAVPCGLKASRPIFECLFLPLTATGVA